MQELGAFGRIDSPILNQQFYPALCRFERCFPDSGPSKPFFFESTRQLHRDRRQGASTAALSPAYAGAELGGRYRSSTASKINQDEVRERYPLKEERSLCALSADSISPKPATLE
jgi:hypothetical protein